MVENSYKKEEPYEKLQFYKNICYLRKRIYQITEPFCKTHPKVVGQTRDAIRSAKQNISEGYKKDSLGIYISHIKISKGSLGETQGDIEDYFEDKLIEKNDFDELSNIIGKTNYMIDRYIDSLYKLKQANKWKIRFKNSN